MIAILAAFQFLTLLPPLVRRTFTPQELGRSVGFYPLVGLALGSILWGVDAGLELLFPTSLSRALTLTSWVILTGALHMDGLLDTCDGLLGGFTAEDRLRIMRDSRVGAFGVVGGALFLLTKYVTLASLPGRTMGLLIAPVVGRWAMSLAVVAFPYGRESGLGRAMKDHAGWPQAVLATATALIAAWLTGRWIGVAVLGLAGVALLAGSLFVLRRIPGLTGDTYGATCEGVELLVLLLLVALQP